MSLIAHYPLNGNTSDIIGDNSNGVTINGNVDVTGKIGSCYTNMGTGGIETGIADMNHSWSIAGWWRHNSTAGESTAFAGTRSGDSGWMLYRNSGDTLKYFRWYLHYNDTSGGVSTYQAWHGVSNIPDLEWVHFVITHDMKGSTEIYMNGVKVVESSTPSNFSSWRLGNTLELGSGGSGGWGATNVSVNDYRIYDHILSEKEVKEIAKAKVLHYSFNDYQEPTTNYIGNGAFNGGLNIENESGSTGSNSIIEFANPGSSKYVLLQPPSSNQEYEIHLKSGESMQPNSTYCMSCWVSHSPDFNGSRQIHHSRWYDGSGGAYITSGDGTLYETRDVAGVTWEKRYTLFTTPSTTSGSYYWYLGYPTSSTVGNRYITDVQLEIKDHVTDFVDGSRTGIVTDMSGFGNDSLTLTESSTPEWTSDNRIGSGGYDFTGYNKYIDTGSVLLSTTNGYDSFTFSAWIYPKDSNEHWIVDQYNSSTNRFIWDNHSSGKMRYFVNGTSHYSTTTLPLNTWSFVTITKDSNSLITFYLNGIADGTATNSTVFANINTHVGTYYTRESSYKLDDVRIYKTTLSNDDVVELYNTRAQLDDKGNIHTSEVSTNGFKKTELDYSKWVVGNSGSQTQFSGNGTTAENRVIARDNPNGDNDVIWETPLNESTSNSDGGWNTSTFAIDRTKKYRTSVWIRRENVGNGRTYFGCQGGQVWNIGTTTVNTNPYFTNWLIGNIPEANEGWVLMVAYIHPTDYTGGNDSTNGAYTNDGTKVYSFNDFRWTSTATSSQQRVYLYYSTSVDERQYYYRPRFEEMDGSEPSLNELLNCAEHRPLIDENNDFVFNHKSITNSGIADFNQISEVGISDGLVGYWKLDGDVVDYSGNGNDGNINGPVVSGGLKNTSYLFDGSNDYISASASDLPSGNNPFTVSIWFNLSVLPPSRRDLWSWGSATSTNYNACDVYSNQISFYNYGNDPTNINETFVIDTWYNFTVTYDGLTLKSYLNKDLRSTVNFGNFNVTPSSMINIGRDGGRSTAYFGGKIGETKVFSRALTPEEILIEYKYGLENTGMQIEENGTLFLNSKINEGS